MNKYKNKITEETVLAKQFLEETIIKLNINGYYIDTFIPKNGWIIYSKYTTPQILSDEEFKNNYIPEKILLFD